MTTAVQHRRGTTAEHAAFTGLEGEVTIDTTKDTAVIHDGTLAGGYPLAKENLANVTTSGLSSIDGASTASDDKFFIFDQSATSLKTITRAELNNAIEQDALANVAITGGTINGTAIGGTTPAAGAFTTLSASSTVSGTGFSTYLASPPAIGGTAANTGAFTTLAASGAVTLSGGTANGVAYLNGSKVVTSGSSLTFDGSTLGVSRGTAGTAASFAAGGQTLKIYGDSTSVSVGAGGALAYGTTSTFYDPTNLAQIYLINGSEQMRLTSTALTVQNGAVFNESGGDFDFRVESDTNTHALFVDAGNSRVGVATSAPAQTLDVSGTFQVARSFNSGITVGRFYNSASTSGAQVYDVVHAMSDDAPAIRISEYDSGTAAIVGELTLSGGDNNVQVIGGTGPVILSANRAVGTAGYVVTGERIRLDSTGVVVNETGADLDFRVESDTNTHALFVDAGANAVGVNTSTPASAMAGYDGLVGVGTYGKVVSAYNGSVAASGYIDITLSSGGGSFAGFLTVNNVYTLNANQRTQVTYSVFGRGTNSFSAQLIATDDGSTGSAAITISNPSDGVIRITNSAAVTTALTAAFFGSTGF